MDWDPTNSDSDGYICPPCPVFYPTAEEFQHPLKYISSIRHIGMQAGICKIVPPSGWRPPFAINEKTFRFRTRVQQLNCIEGHSRAEGQFVEALRLFLYQRGQPMKALPRADGQLVNLHLLYKSVVSLGGFDAVCSSSRWEQVVRRVGRTKAASEPSDELCQVYKAHYETTLLAYEKEQRSAKDSSSTVETKIQATPLGANATGDIKATPSSKPRTLSGRKRPAFIKHEETEDDGHRVKRTLFSDGEQTSSEENEAPKTETRVQDEKRKSLEPAALKPLETRQCRLGAPEIRAGQKFYRFFPDAGAVLAEVKRVFGGKKPHVAVRYVEDGSNDDVELSTMEILIANGWDASAAELAYNSEICQVCLRGDCWDRMLLCDGCNSGQHIFCLDEPLDKVPTGDWYCKECVDDAMDPDKGKDNPKFGFDMGAEISMVDYKQRADAWKRDYFSLSSDTNPDDAISDRELEAEYWRLLSIPIHEQRLEVQYGSDVDTGANGSAFPRHDLYLKSLRTVAKRWKNLTTKAKTDYVRQLSEFFSHGLREGLGSKAGGENDATDAAQSLEELLQRYAQDDWNLNNMPKLSGSVLQYLDEDIKGIMVPWLYAGMCFSTFCWHVEDHNFYSTSYLHCGAPKTWYGIPSASAEHFERTMKQLTPELFGSQPDLHMQLVTMFSPKTLREHGVPVYRATHRPNEFVVTFPSAYHAGFNNGFNCAEAVNFATLDWLAWGAKSLKKYREFRKLPVFCHDALVCTLAETLADGNSFDYENTRSSLLPAVEQLLQDYQEFQRRVDSSEMRVEKRELMAEYEKHGAVIATDPEASSMRRSMVARACNKPAKMGGNRGSKMRTKMETSMRPTRMVLWAGRSGKHEGLRCVTCKQYCYLQAVVCTRCRPPQASNGGPTVGCLEHYPTMCKCRDPTNFVYLYRYEASRLEDMIRSLRTRLDSVQDWNKECDAAMQAAREYSTQDAVSQPAITDLKQLLSRGKASGGADMRRLDSLEFWISSADKWDVRAERLLLSLRQDRSAASLSDWESLLLEAGKLLVKPSTMGKLRDVVNDWRAARTEAIKLLNTVQRIVNDEIRNNARPRSSSADTSLLVQCMGAPNVLLHDNVHFGRLCTAITRVSERLRAKKESGADGSFLSQLARGQRYLEVLCKVNVLAATIVDRTQGGTVMGTPTQGQVERVLREVLELRLSNPNSIANAGALQQLVAAAESVAREIEDALRDGSKSSEELEVLLRRAIALPIPPGNTQSLKDRLEKCRVWERRAHQILAVSRAMVERPSLEEVERFYAQADAHFVSGSSLLRRQVHSRLQDCRRWHDAVHALFLRPSNSHLPLSQFLQTALDKAQHQHGQNASQALQIHSRLHCVCQQVLSERAHVASCQQCQQYFHPQCVPELMPSRSKDAFLCGSCRPQRKRPERRSTDAPIFCLCRGVERAPMICCDFCDEWYHASCVDLSPVGLETIDAFRCPRCARRQHLYYMDKKLLRRECLGRRPTLSRVESFVAQMQTQLVACPPGAQELVAYIHTVKTVESDVTAFVRTFASRAFSPAAYATEQYVQSQEGAVIRLMERVTNLEVGLETAQVQLGAVHWCLRACQLVLGPSDRAPRYAHLVALLQDVKSQEPGFAFPRQEYRLMQWTIAERVNKAAQWLRAAKSLEVEEWNVEKAQQLLRLSDELSAYLQLPPTELQLVQRIIDGGMATRAVQGESRVAWKKQRHW
ncbi:PLU-1-like protein [Phytophthora infestans]|uniref:[histone H3]-trimethyl-L-lysine(4) demethylase n=1 Tax=Phytophthora infestans TaxID=4787 RepID=A0A8S9VBD6_PHYIN|nr:PLU-1-like protein [Phytophthora infestans]